MHPKNNIENFSLPLGFEELILKDGENIDKDKLTEYMNKMGYGLFFDNVILGKKIMLKDILSVI